MFRCYFCQEITPPKTKKTFVVIETREKTYPARRSESRRHGRFRPPADSSSNDTGGKGRETQKEVPACPACAAKQHEAVVVPQTPVVEPESTDTPSDSANE